MITVGTRIRYHANRTEDEGYPQHDGETATVCEVLQYHTRWPFNVLWDHDNSGPWPVSADEIEVIE